MTGREGRDRDLLVTARVVHIDPERAIEDGAVRVRRGRIAAVGPRRELGGGDTSRIDLGRAVLAPGLVNAHTHLALSGLGHLRPRRPAMADWLRGLRRAAPALGGRALAAALVRGVSEAIAAGTTAFGDIVPAAALAISRRLAPGGVRFLEVLGFGLRWSDLELPPLRHGEGLAPHALHTTSADIYRGAVRWARRERRPLALHASESAEEVEFTRTGRGELRAFRDDREPLPAGFRPPGVRPIAALDRLGALGPRSLVVHATFATPAEQRLIARRGAAVVTCPRSNLALTGRTADVPALLRLGIPVALGTDSLASAPTLSLLDEMRALRAAHPTLDATAVLRAATVAGARALGLEAGVIAPGLRADLAAFALPRGNRTPAEAILAARRALFVMSCGRVLHDEH